MDIAIGTEDFLTEENITRLENELNINIGKFWWKSYVSMAFWNNISTPINLTITIITALTTAQYASKDLFSEVVMGRLSFSVLIITTLNTFFRPSAQLQECNENLNNWRNLGNQFERIYVETSSNSIGEIKTREEKYKELMEKVLDLRRNQKNNFLTDVIYYISKITCIKDNEKWKKDIF